MQPIQIVATIGPACSNADGISGLVAAGMSIARLNFSWGTHAEHREFVSLVRQVATDHNVQIPIIQDLSGPRVQTGDTHTFTGDVAVITEKDRSDILALVDLSIEYIALSFVQGPRDIAQLRTILHDAGSQAKIIAKIERQEALDNLDAILATTDGVMIARGDLGDAVPFATLPFVKKDILKRCMAVNKPAIVATEMLTSMIEKERPSRADVSDIAHAVLDGASATMLSNETAVGQYPSQAVAAMRAVVDEAQKHSQHTVVTF